MSVALKKEQLEELIVGQDQIESYDVDQLFDVKFESNEYGPILLTDLKNHIEGNDLYQNDIEVKSHSTNQWQKLVTHPSFQRRRPQVLDPKHDGQSYYILVDGQKTGPFSVNKINELIDQKTLLYTDMVCLIGENEWVKIHSVNAFDRRKLTNNELPKNLNNENLSYDKKTRVKYLF